MSNTEVDKFSATVDVIDEMPEQAYGRTGRWIDLVREAAADGKPRRLNFGGLLDDKDVDRVRRQLSHTAATIGRGIRTAAETIDGKTAISYQVVDKRPRRSAQSGETVAPVAPAKAGPSKG